MNYIVEVCIDNIESLHRAIEGGANRIELCSSLALGGLTPSFGLMKQAGKFSSIPVYAMIRPRQGDFLYTDEEIESMLIDIEAAAAAKLQGVVIGTLNADGYIDMTKATRLVNKAKSLNLGVTFHRAIDQCADYQRSIEDIAKLGCERVLTSGLATNVEQGIDILRHMVELANDRFSIMAGAGLNAENVCKIVSESAVQEVHLSGKSTRPSKMKLIAEQAKMGNQNIDDFVVPVTDPQAIEKVVKALTSS
ncbi:copper homeostasis protein CutC [Vibrio sp. Isolate25]|uniref:copper homeostasis protein CutC n=1 Tax=Vibrio sp. Isolate25 TaxID=2908535 RepID=UPI001EFEE9C9|nr:copper homeostasis protein CutC [Vibrio sp. Isolate25]MCG9598215.1 copper homeostasis protein CutC [Vibrio sp. Isolate25]